MLSKEESEIGFRDSKQPKIISRATTQLSIKKDLEDN